MLTSLGLRDFSTEDVKFAAYLTKPIKPAVLYSTLLSVFSSQEVDRKRIKKKSAIEPLFEPLPPLRILMAEDMVVNQKVALLLLGRIGCRADVVSNGLEVLEALHRQLYDVILMDVQMPEMDGLEAARAVRSGTWQDSRQQMVFASQPYIIAMTANAMQGDREDCMAAGMDDYVSKPVQIEELAHALSRAAMACKPENSKHQEVMLKSAGSKIDVDVFHKFQASLGEENQSMLAELVREFLAEGEQLATEIHAAAIKGDVEGVRRAAHSLKSSSQMFGALDLAQTCKLMESKARSGSLEQMTELVVKMELDFEAVKADLQGWLSSNSN